MNGYKRFRNTTIDLGEHPPKVVALVGPNGSGKSSVFDGMLYLQSKYAHIGSTNMGQWQFHSMDGNSNFDNTWQQNVRINFDIGEFENVFRGRNQHGLGKTLFSFRSPYRYSSQLNVTTLSKINDVKENSTGAGATVHLDEKVGDNYQRLYSLVDRKYKAPGSQLTYEQVKADVLGELNNSLRDVLEITISNHGDILDGKGTLYFKKRGQDNEFEFNVLSSGEKEVVDILIDIFVKKESFTETIYIIDEPELHINSGIQRRLLNKLVQIIPDSSQLWIATHSIGFLNALKQDHHNDSAVILFPSNLSTETVTLSPMIKNRRNWKLVFETALEDLTGLMAPEVIVYCEGRKEPGEDGEEQGIDAEVYNLIFETEFPNVLFVSSGGNTEPDKYSEIALKVLGKAFDDVKILLLKDKDIHADATPTSDQERLNWISQYPETRRMLGRREMENYLYDYEILQKINHVDAGQYRGIVTDINEQDVKAAGFRLRQICGRDQESEVIFKRSLAALVTPDTGTYIELKRTIFPEE